MKSGGVVTISKVKQLRNKCVNLTRQLKQRLNRPCGSDLKWAYFSRNDPFCMKYSYFCKWSHQSLHALSSLDFSFSAWATLLVSYHSLVLSPVCVHWLEKTRLILAICPFYFWVLAPLCMYECLLGGPNVSSVSPHLHQFLVCVTFLDMLSSERKLV